MAATHIALEAIDVRGHFLPLALIPLQPFMDQPTFAEGFRHQPLFRLSWYGHPTEIVDENADDKGGAPKSLQT